MQILKITFIAMAIIMVGLITYYLGYTRGDSSGYDDGYQNGIIDGAGTGYDYRDPTYFEMKQFLKNDDTDNNEYIEGIYTCTDYAADLNNNALEAGYNAAYVYIDYSDGSGHSIDAFQTVDRGLIFIEPQFDKEVQVTVGSSYSDLNGFQAADHDDTIVRYVLVW